MKILLCDIDKNLVTAWKKYFQGISAVRVYQGSIFDNPCDAIVSPANSFGFMDGGLDLALSKYLGWHVQTELQEIIKSKYHGELLVGQAEILKTGNAHFPYLISAPTMRVPLVLTKSVNAFLAMRAILLLVKTGVFEDGTPISDAIQSIVISGLGTGVGEMPAELCALQMRVAYGQVVLKETIFPKSWQEIGEMHHFLIGSHL